MEEIERLSPARRKRSRKRGSSKFRRRNSSFKCDESDENDILRMYDEDYKDEPTTEEDLLEQISEQKELIENVQCQPWPMAKKMKILKLAKAFVEKHEGQLSKSKGYQQKGKQIFRQLKRNWENLVTSLVPWEMRIKRIESHFGSVVASYFVFLRWLIWINLFLTLMSSCFIIAPELIAGEPHGSNSRKSIPQDELHKAYDFKTIWDAEGIMRQSLLFYGYYGNTRIIGDGYRLPLAYLLVGIATFAYSFIVVLKRMASNSRQSRMSNKDEQFTFSWKLFTEWDYMVGNQETAKTKHASIITTFRESILEEKEKTREKLNKLLVFFRILANVLVLMSLALSAYIVQLCVERGREMELKQLNEPDFVAGFWDEQELTIVMTLISTIFPNISDLISIMEKYHPRTSLRIQLARIFALNLLNLYTLFIALYNKQNDLKKFAQSLNATSFLNSTACPLYQSSMTTMTSVQQPSSVDGNYTPVSNGTVWSTTVSTPNTDCLLPNNITLNSLCWETMIGQEIFKLTVMDLVFVLGQIIIIDVIRGVFIRYCNSLCCWDMEKKFPEYPDFKTAENLLHLINNQGMVWIGSFFAPGLPMLNLFKLLLLVYVRCWTVLVCNVPQENIFRASRSNNFYYALSLVMLFLCMLPPLFSIVAIDPSPGCGPFSGQDRMYHILTDTMETELPDTVNGILDYAASPGVILPVFMLLCMTIYYLMATGKSLQDANNELRMQLEYERTDGRKKVYAMADAKQAGNSNVVKKTDGKKDDSKRLNNAAASVMAAARLAQMMTASNIKDGVQLRKVVPDTSDKSIPVAVVHGKRSIKGIHNSNKDRDRERQISRMLQDNLVSKNKQNRQQQKVVSIFQTNNRQNIESSARSNVRNQPVQTSSDDSVEFSNDEDYLVKRPQKVPPKVSQKPKVSYINEIAKRNPSPITSRNNIKMEVKNNVVRAVKKTSPKIPKIRVYDYSQDSADTNEQSDDVMETDDTILSDRNTLEIPEDQIDSSFDSDSDSESEQEQRTQRTTNNFASVLAQFQKRK